MSDMKEIFRRLPESIIGHITSKHGTFIRRLLKSYQKYYDREIDNKVLLFESQFVLNHSWEMLNIGKWIEVPVEHKQTYSIAAYIYATAFVEDGGSVEKTLEVIDKGILLGQPVANLDLTRVALDLSALLQHTKHSTKQNIIQKSEHNKTIKVDNEIHTTSCPSLEHFQKVYFGIKPVKVLNNMKHWPALQLWCNLEYLKEKSGHRTVPIEVGKYYTDASYSQKLMRVSEFIDKFFSADCKETGYLAQHQLFDQVPELKDDIRYPEYCVLSDNYDGEQEEAEINAWFGPGGTVSPLHFDPKHNLLSQVVGTKLVSLYPDTDSRYLYPHESPLLFNTSQVDIESPNSEAYPMFSLASKSQCLLQPGEMLYIPPKWWHHVRALEPSFSVSFWWQ